jgi:formylglycine-generating enzyme required for sulfatase activity
MNVRQLLVLACGLMLLVGFVSSCSQGAAPTTSFVRHDTDDDSVSPDDDTSLNDDDDNDDDDDDDNDNDDDNDDNDDDDDDNDSAADPGYIVISPGTFVMGSPLDEPGRDPDEDQHAVTLTHNYEMSIYQTQQDEFATLMGWNPSDLAACGGKCPVESTSWFDALVYANELSAGAGYEPCFALSNIVCHDSSTPADPMTCETPVHGGIDAANVTLNAAASIYECEGYRLPTEAEYEYAVRAGTTTALYDGPIVDVECTPLDPNMNVIGWYCGNSGNGDHPVGLKQPNAWGLYDMSGNVWEWVWDIYGVYPGTTTDPTGPPTGDRRVNRGGGWNYRGAGQRSANRGCDTPDHRYVALGYRLARTVP